MPPVKTPAENLYEYMTPEKYELVSGLIGEKIDKKNLLNPDTIIKYQHVLINDAQKHIESLKKQNKLMTWSCIFLVVSFILGQVGKFLG